MPRALDPNDTFDVVLDSDKNKDPQPTFVFRAATGRQWRQMGIALDKPGVEVGAYCDHLYDAVKTTLTNWHGMNDIAYDQEKLEDLITPIEAREILHKVLEQGVLSPEAKKNSGSSP